MEANYPSSGFRGEERGEREVEGRKDEEKIKNRGDETGYESTGDFVAELWDLAADRKPAGVSVPFLAHLSYC